MSMSPSRPVFFAMCLAAISFLVAGTAGAQTEVIVVSGGPAMRQWEDLRKPGEQHDRWWGNFVRSARVRMQEIKKATPQGTIITWLVYRDAYARRSVEDRQPLVSFVESVRDTYGVRLVWIRSGSDVINYINSGMNRRSVKVSGFEYFGHSNKYCFMFDYSSDVYGGWGVAARDGFETNSVERLHSECLLPELGMSHGRKHECGLEEGDRIDAGGGVWEDGLLERASFGMEGSTGARGVVAAAVGGFFHCKTGCWKL